MDPNVSEDIDNVLAEIDRKIDDGAPESGSFRTDSTVNIADCVSSSVYNIASGSKDCGGVRIM